jgi:hypothetical protein
MNGGDRKEEIDRRILWMGDRDEEMEESSRAENPTLNFDYFLSEGTHLCSIKTSAPKILDYGERTDFLWLSPQEKVKSPPSVYPPFF